MSTVFEGAFTALVTPFTTDGQIDEEALRRLVERQVDGGIDGIVPCGTTGEATTLTVAEQARVVSIVVEQAKGRVPILAGGGTNSTHETINLSKGVKEAGADGLLLVCPYYNKPTQAGLEAHFRAVAAAVDLPIVLYNVPGRTQSDLAAETVARLADVPSIVGIKEATANVLRTEEVLALTGDRFSILSGDDPLTLPIMAAGGRGVISVTSNLFPREVTKVVHDVRGGDLAAARSLNLRLFPVHRVLFIESNPAPTKYALAKAGLIQEGLRLPLVWPTEASQQRIDEVLAASGLSL